jgi:16S rRNA (guanine(966)-N(2))-methyltransferase RsmD
MWQWRLAGATFLDCYAGSGAMALEALSRGAERAVAVERHPEAVAVIRKNARALGVASQLEVRAELVEACVARWARQQRRFCLIFCDPPWAQGLSASVRANLFQILDETGWVAIEHRAQDPAPDVAGLRRIQTRRYGDTAISHYERDPTRPPAGDSANH